MRIVLTLIPMITFMVIANLLLKTGATSAGAGQGHFLHLLNWRVLLGLGLFALSSCSYILLLQWLPLNVAQSFAALQFVAVVLASALVLAEPIGAVQWVGIALITTGVAIVGWSQQ